MAAAIVLDAAAFSLWNLAARSPARLVRDVAAGVSRPASVLRGGVRFVTGVLLLLAAGVLLLPLAIAPRTFTVLETWTVLTALLVDQLLGGYKR